MSEGSHDGRVVMIGRILHAPFEAAFFRHVTPLAWAVAVSVVLLLQGGCSLVPPIDSPRPGASRDPLPLKVGVYYAPDFRKREEVFTKQYIETYTFRLGKPSVELFNRVIGLTFAEAIALNELPPNQAPDLDLDAVIEPYFAEATPFYGSTNPSGFGYVLLKMTLRYGFRLYSMEGEQLAEWEVEGFASSAAGPGEGKSYTTDIPMVDAFLSPVIIATMISDMTSDERNPVSARFAFVTELAMAIAAQKFHSGADKVPEIMRLLEAHGISS
jgi:hypothetical protein